MELIKRIFQPPRGSFFLFGPRGTGKSTWLRETFPHALFVDLLDAAAFREYSAHPERLEAVLGAHPEAADAVIDEVQKVPALLDVVHQVLERKDRRPPRLILTGSSARRLRRTGVDLLAGRVLLQTFHPFMAAELGRDFDLTRALRLGMLPLVHGAVDPEQALRSYVSLYLQQEVQAEALVRDIGAFARFLEAISFSHGAMLNVTEVGRECAAGQKTVEGYVQVLEDLLLGFRLHPFTKRARRNLVHHPKFYYVDAGVFRSVRPKGPLDKPEEIGGACLEGLVAQHLRAWLAYANSDAKLYFWRTRSGVEVDFVIYGRDTFTAIEVKNSGSPHSKDVRSLLAFLEDYPQARACLLHGGRERLKIGGVLCLPCEEFLRRLRPGEQIPLA